MSLHLQCRMMESVVAGEAGVTLVTGLAALPAQHIALFFPVPAVTALVKSRNGVESVKRRPYNVPIAALALVQGPLLSKAEAFHWQVSVVLHCEVLIVRILLC